MMPFKMGAILEPEVQPLVRRLLRPQAVRIPMRSRFVHPADCATGPQRGYVIKHFIAPGDVGALIGQPSSGKSILAPHLAYAVAQGRPIFGMRTKPGRVLYICAEDFGGMKDRVHALKLRHGDAPDLAIVNCGSLLAKAELNDMQATVVDWKPALVIIDTLGAAWAGLDENSAQDMGMVVGAARAVAGTGAACLIVHHIAKQGDGSPRGHSVLNGTLDMSLRLEAKNEAGIIRGTMLKNRNGTTDRDIAFRFEVVEVGTDDDGEAITAPRAIELGDTDAKPASDNLTRTERSAFAVLKEMVNATGTPMPAPDNRITVLESDWRSECDNRRISTSDNAKSRGDVFRRAFSTLLSKGKVEVGGGLVWLPLGPEAAILATIARQSPQSLIAQ